ncbi:putative Ribosomal RNA processing protein 7 (RRP7) [Trypanosoma vivax]|nr:putative Ribosomal RNA processing protein 7 (RRP7) [Trypanosoma vivax]
MVAKGKKGLAQKAKTACELAGAKRPAGPSSVAAQEEPHCAEKGHDKQLIERIICGEDGKRDIAASSTAVDNLLQYPYLPFLEDYAQHKRSEVVDPDALLEKAHTYFMEYGKRESTLHRAAAKRLKELKEINRRGGDKDGFRYVLPRNVKEAAKLMVEGSDALCSQLASTFGGGEQNDQPPHETSDRPTRRHRRKSRCFSDFYQFQVSKRWTRNAEKFLEKGRAQKSLFVPSRQQRSIRKF